MVKIEKKLIFQSSSFTMSVFQIYCKNLKTCNISTSNFDIDIFQKYLEVYKDLYCSHYEKNNYSENMKEYIDKINSITISNYVKVGKYFLNHQNILFQLKNIQKNNPNYYLIVPAYDSCFECEVQIGVTGSIKMGEHPINCLKREVEEELGIVIGNNNIKVNPKTKNIYFYEVEINSKFKIKKNKKNKNLNGKDSKYKISCLIYGNLKDTKNLLLKSKLPYHFIKGEDISHTLLVPIELAIKITETIISYKCDKNHAKGCRLYHG